MHAHYTHLHLASGVIRAFPFVEWLGSQKGTKACTTDANTDICSRYLASTARPACTVNWEIAVEYLGRTVSRGRNDTSTRLACNVCVCACDFSVLFFPLMFDIYCELGYCCLVSWQTCIWMAGMTCLVFWQTCIWMAGMTWAWDLPVVLCVCVCGVVFYGWCVIIVVIWHEHEVCLCCYLRVCVWFSILWFMCDNSGDFDMNTRSALCACACV